jgi:hypothetical protein
MKPIMSDAQYRALTSVMNRDGAGDLVRYLDGSVSTLIAMTRPGRRWVTLEWDIVDGRRQIVGATVRNAGHSAYAAETTRRAEQATRDARHAEIVGTPSTTPAPRGITAQVDPFALFANRREMAIPF